MGGTSTAGRGQVLLKLREVVQVLDWTWTQVVFGGCLPSMELNSFISSFSGNVPHLLSEAVFSEAEGNGISMTPAERQPAEMLPEFQKHFLQSGAGSLAWGRARCGWPLTLCRLGHLTFQVTAASWLRLGACMMRY